MGDDWKPPARPAGLTEQRLIEAFLDGEFPVGATLPAERELAGRLGVTRPTLREALQRLARDGWITIQQGKPTRVNDFWWEGNLNVLGSIVRYGRSRPPDFVPNLLAVRLALAPAYTRAAVDRHPATVAQFLAPYPALTQDPAVYAVADWQLHRCLIRASDNPIYMLIFNGFSGFYVQMARPYFENPQARAASQRFYHDLLAAARDRDPHAAAEVAHRAMQESIQLWQERPP
jgi:GntR family transcriptional regulator, negative regulator for fad regulon and positive regulator of fabA